jgi:hypothetical protein
MLDVHSVFVLLFLKTNREQEKVKWALASLAVHL